MISINKNQEDRALSPYLGSSTCCAPPPTCVISVSRMRTPGQVTCLTRHKGPSCFSVLGPSSFSLCFLNHHQSQPGTSVWSLTAQHLPAATEPCKQFLVSPAPCLSISSGFSKRGVFLIISGQAPIAGIGRSGELLQKAGNLPGVLCIGCRVDPRGEPWLHSLTKPPQGHQLHLPSEETVIFRLN